jgi:hypothetical protein
VTAVIFAPILLVATFLRPEQIGVNEKAALSLWMKTREVTPSGKNRRTAQHVFE